MKKFLLGCAFFLLLLGVASAVGGYFFVYKPAKGLYEDLVELAEWKDGIENQTAWQPPADNEIPADRLDAFVTIQRRNVDRFGDQFEAFTRWARELQNNQNEPPATLGALRDLLSEAGGFMRTYREARAEFVVMLNDANFTWAEYAWIRSRFRSQISNALNAEQLRELASQGIPTGVEMPGMATPPPADPSANAGGKPGTDAPGDTAPGPDVTEGRVPASASRIPTFVAPYVQELPQWAALWTLDF